MHYIGHNDYDPTIEDIYHTNIEIDGKYHKLEIPDTAGEDDYQNFLNEWISFADGFILVFGIDDYECLERMKNKYNRIRKLGKEKNPMILVGNMKNLQEKDRKVTIDKAQQFAKSLGIEYIEICSETGYNISEVFNNIAKKILKFKEKSIGKRKKCIIV